MNKRYLISCYDAKGVLAGAIEVVADSVVDAVLAAGSNTVDETTVHSIVITVTYIGGEIPDKGFAKDAVGELGG